MKFKVLCLHNKLSINSLEVVANYYPLKLEEVLAMIQIAYCCDFNFDDYCKQVNEIQERLMQGIMGMTCPSPNEGEIASRAAKIGELFLKAIEKDNDILLVMKLALLIFELMTFEKYPEDI